MVWKDGRSWAGRSTHMGYFQEAYDAGCAAIARAEANFLGADLNFVAGCGPKWELMLT